MNKSRCDERTSYTRCSGCELLPYSVLLTQLPSSNKREMSISVHSIGTKHWLPTEARWDGSPSGQVLPFVAAMTRGRLEILKTTTMPQIHQKLLDPPKLSQTIH